MEPGVGVGGPKKPRDQSRSLCRDREQAEKGQRPGSLRRRNLKEEATEAARRW